MKEQKTITITLNDGRNIVHKHDSTNEVSECQKYLETIGKTDKDVAWVTFDGEE